MSKRTLVITKSDLLRLQQLLNSDFTKALGPRQALVDLESELVRADIVAPEQVPRDVVTMNSTIRLRDMETGEVELYTLVYPHEANIAQQKLSILAPIGTAILGYRVGDELRWKVPGGLRRLLVEEVLYQPEREGLLHL